jgi:hypothetical protein
MNNNVNIFYRFVDNYIYSRKLLLKKERLMKKILTLLILTSSMSFGQEVNINKWSIDGAFGFNNSIKPFSHGYGNNYVNLYSLSGGARYMFNNNFGVKADLGFDKFRNGKTSLDFSSTLLKGSFKGVMDLGNILDFYTFTPSLSFITYGGFGFGALSGEEFAILKGADNLYFLTVGFMPQYRINDKMSLYLDATLSRHGKQNRTFDFNGINPAENESAVNGNLLIGMSFYLGKSPYHLDWTDGMQINPIEEPIVEVIDTVEVAEEVVEVVEVEIEEIIADTVVSEVVNPTGGTEPDLTQAKSANGMTGLFFTVQIGAYDYYKAIKEHDNLDNVYSITLPDGKVRFCSGAFDNETDLRNHLKAVKAKGYSDAFGCAYYEGERIQVYQARQLLKAKGPGILQELK